MGPLTEIPPELFLEMADYLEAPELAKLGATCRSCHNIVSYTHIEKATEIWRSVPLNRSFIASNTMQFEWPASDWWDPSIVAVCERRRLDENSVEFAFTFESGTRKILKFSGNLQISSDYVNWRAAEHSRPALRHHLRRLSPVHWQELVFWGASLSAVLLCGIFIVWQRRRYRAACLKHEELLKTIDPAAVTA